MPDDWFERLLAESGFIARYPLYAAVLAKLIPVRTSSVAIMAVAMNPRGRAPGTYLLVNPDYFAEHPEHRAGVLMHEVHHLVLGHLTDAKFRAAAHPGLMELAMEVSANEYIDEQLPPACTWERYEAMGLRPGQSTLERYALLVAAHEAGDDPLPSPDASADAPANVPSGGPSSTSRGVPPNPSSVDDHRPPDGGGLGEHVSPTTDGALRDVHRLGEECFAANGTGLPSLLAGPLSSASLDSMMRGLTEPRRASSPVHWRAILDRLVVPRRSCTWQRPNRRFPDRVGVIPGRRRQRPRPTLLAAIDTSGSMTPDVLTRIVRELRSLSRHADLTVVECDDAIRRVYPFRGEISAVAGGGNTDFRPVFASDLLHAHGIDAVVYFTDGLGTYPEQPPSVPALWCLTADVPFGCTWGQRVQLLGSVPPPS